MLTRSDVKVRLPDSKHQPMLLFNNRVGARPPRVTPWDPGEQVGALGSGSRGPPPPPSVLESSGARQHAHSGSMPLALRSLDCAPSTKPLECPEVCIAPSPLPEPIPLRADWVTGVLAPRLSGVRVDMAWICELECSMLSLPT